ncbi:YicC/YloC family endoribonuclease [Desulfopila sp. IMCC35008]|uniref:YicC/YloC family endoribonuclease n=1 Tax=Desulfopila sp. IMCC35008 TaxID=2653858 RepID=UPI0013D2A9CA|nr:YicC/YloC family endoribonuclease [Desulfopila sp. IMCC35008]
MTIRSMTGFGRGESENKGRSWSAEIRCVNNRFLDVKIKLPRGYLALEERIRKLVSEFHQRGRVDLVVSVSGDFTDLLELKVNSSLAATYMETFREMADTFKLTAPSTVTELAACPDVLTREQKEDDVDSIWPTVEQAIKQMLSNCEMMRSQEGATMADDLRARLTLFSQTVASIEASVPVLLVQRENSLRERLQKLLENVELDPQRLAQEIAILADKTDVTEEIVRLKSHIQQFTSFLDEDGAVGRKLDFLIQEFLREVNTIASKINDADIAHLTVDLKSELEKMREQVQNIE